MGCLPPKLSFKLPSEIPSRRLQMEIYAVSRDEDRIALILVNLFLAVVIVFFHIGCSPIDAGLAAPLGLVHGTAEHSGAGAAWMAHF